MTPKEFKAWFDGFTEGINGTPNDAQWARIKARVAEIDGTQISYPVFVDRYERRPYWTGPVYTAASGTLGNCFNSVSAMYSVGKDEFNQS